MIALLDNDIPVVVDTGTVYLVVASVRTSHVGVETTASAFWALAK